MLKRKPIPGDILEYKFNETELFKSTLFICTGYLSEYILLINDLEKNILKENYIFWKFSDDELSASLTILFNDKNLLKRLNKGKLMNKPIPCDTCSHLYYNCLLKDDSTHKYKPECNLNKEMGNENCVFYEHYEYKNFKKNKEELNA